MSLTKGKILMSEWNKSNQREKLLISSSQSQYENTISDPTPSVEPHLIPFQFQDHVHSR